MNLKRLESGYWHARWSGEVWAQWPCNRPVQPEDFFHDTATPKRIREVERALACLDGQEG